MVIFTVYTHFISPSGCIHSSVLHSFLPCHISVLPIFNTSLNSGMMVLNFLVSIFLENNFFNLYFWRLFSSGWTISYNWFFLFNALKCMPLLLNLHQFSWEASCKLWNYSFEDSSPFYPLATSIFFASGMRNPCPLQKKK